MERFERLVPPRELCEKIPHIKDRVAAVFNDSALVHAYSEPRMGWQVLPRDSVDFNDCPLYPAPTLVEILQEFHWDSGNGTGLMSPHIFYHGDNPEVEFAYGLSIRAGTMELFRERDVNPTIAALKLWLKVRKAIDKQV